MQITSWGMFFGQNYCCCIYICASTISLCARRGSVCCERADMVTFDRDGPSEAREWTFCSVGRAVRDKKSAILHQGNLPNIWW